MDIDFAELLIEVIERNASDLHLTAGAHPTVRVRGHLVALEEYPVMTTEMTRELIYGILSNDQRQRLENDWQIDFAYSIPERARFRVNA
jgi:twitching motility protein PilT